MSAAARAPRLDSLSFDELIAEFIRCIEIRKAVDYGDKHSVRTYNRAADRYGKIVDRIDEHFPDRREDFAALMHSEDSDVRSTAALCVLTQIHYTPEMEKQALKNIREYFRKDPLAGIARDIWFDDWRSGRIPTRYNPK